MRNLILLLFSCLVLIACGSGVNDASRTQEAIDTLVLGFSSKQVSKEIVEEFKEELLIYVPIDLLKEDETNPYKRYGIEFSGNCYACDLAEFQIQSKNLLIVNVCDTSVVKNFPVERHVLQSKNGYKFSNSALEFVLEKVSEGPVYELKGGGNLLSFENLRISRFYTIKDSLVNFEAHDCGDFDG